MSDDSHKWVDALVTGVIVGVATGTFFLVKAVVLLLLRCWDKYREHDLMRGIFGAWAAALALSFTLLPAGGALAGGLAMSSTLIALGGLAVSELILDYRSATAEAAEEDLTHHLGPW
jgi:hypothetical protein